MHIKIYKSIGFLALLGFFAVMVWTLPAEAKSTGIPAGFYQLNNLEIFKGPVVNEPSATIEALQKNDKSCVIYEGGKTSQPLSCVFEDSNVLYNTLIIQIDEKATLQGVNQESALLTDFKAGDKINVLGWLSADQKTIRAAVVRSLESKDFHQSLSGTITKISADGFTLKLANGDEVLVKTPLVEGAQMTVKGVFDKTNNIVNNVLSILIRPTIVETPAAEKAAPAPAPVAKPSTLFKNFLKVFGL